MDFFVYQRSGDELAALRIIFSLLHPNLSETAHSFANSPEHVPHILTDAYINCWLNIDRLNNLPAIVDFLQPLVRKSAPDDGGGLVFEEMYKEIHKSMVNPYYYPSPLPTFTTRDKEIFSILYTRKMALDRISAYLDLPGYVILQHVKNVTFFLTHLLQGLYSKSTVQVD